MDPDVTLTAMLDAYTGQQHALAYQAASDLQDWIRKGGFTPDLDALSREKRLLLLSLACEAIRMSL